VDLHSAIDASNGELLASIQIQDYFITIWSGNQALWIRSESK